MFDRQNQPTWLKLVNLLALLSLGAFIFTADSSRPAWAITAMVAIFLVAAALNFLIQFRDLFGPSSNVAEESEQVQEAESDTTKLDDVAEHEDEDAAANRAWLQQRQQERASQQSAD